MIIISHLDRAFDATIVRRRSLLTVVVAVCWVVRHREQQLDSRHVRSTIQLWIVELNTIRPQLQQFIHQHSQMCGEVGWFLATGMKCSENEKSVAVPKILG